MVSLVERFICNHEYTTYDEEKNVYKYKCNVQAKDAHDIIEIEEIIAACDNIEKRTENLDIIRKNILQYSEMITIDYLSIEGQGVDQLAKEISKITKDIIETKIVEHIQDVKKNAIDTYNKLQTEYNDIAMMECKHS